MHASMTSLNRAILRPRTINLKNTASDHAVGMAWRNAASRTAESELEQHCIAYLKEIYSEHFAFFIEPLALVDDAATTERLFQLLLMFGEVTIKVKPAVACLRDRHPMTFLITRLSQPAGAWHRS
jgi:hypothetical protein